ncbi:RNA polymerase sigma factor [Actinoplanes sp. RD1]|uniref:RNA polymerase sigma factor n=1 Tax=Actinoplanes sp. RD1 TaxID=3064538 RepID=UPI002741B8F5|nr:sigma-70 family RNA polymerase sigma factor [Actinoplanes sp. RD1]
MTITEDDLRQTVLDAQSGDAQAYETLVRAFDTQVRRTVRTFRLSEADTEDAVQNTWLRLVEHLPEIREPARTGAWLVTVARRECLRLLRTGRREVIGLPAETDPADDRGPHPERVAVDHAMNDLLWEHVNRLPQPARVLLTTLTSGNAPGYAEYARAARMPVGSIGPTRMRSLRKLRSELEGSGLGSCAWH